MDLHAYIRTVVEFHPENRPVSRVLNYYNDLVLNDTYIQRQRHFAARLFVAVELKLKL